MAGRPLKSLFPLINQENNRQLLLNTIRNTRVGNAYLFYGSEGSGHEGYALEFAAMLNCSSENEIPCGMCPSCRKVRTLEHGNIDLVFPIPINNLKKDDSPFKSFSDEDMEEVRNAILKKAEDPYSKIIIQDGKHIPINFIREIKKKIYLTSAENGYKVIIILDADTLTEPASNAFLKILEEPPGKSVFILTSSNATGLLPTIRSRCQSLFFPAISSVELCRFLREKNVAEDQINLIIRLSGGDVHQAMHLTSTDMSQLREMTLETMRMIATWKIDKIYDLVNRFSAIYKKDSEEFERLMCSISYWFRDAAALKSGESENELIHTDMKVELRKFVDYYTDLDAFAANSAVDNCIDLVNHNVYINLALLNMFFKIHEGIQPRRH